MRIQAPLSAGALLIKLVFCASGAQEHCAGPSCDEMDHHCPHHLEKPMAGQNWFCAALKARSRRKCGFPPPKPHIAQRTPTRKITWDQRSLVRLCKSRTATWRNGHYLRAAKNILNAKRSKPLLYASTAAVSCCILWPDHLLKAGARRRPPSNGTSHSCTISPLAICANGSMALI